MHIRTGTTISCWSGYKAWPDYLLHEFKNEIKLYLCTITSVMCYNSCKAQKFTERKWGTLN